MATLPSSSDPYYVVRDEVQSMVRSAQAMHEEWRKLLVAENTARSQRFQDLHAKLDGELRQIEYVIQDISATIETVENNRARFSFDDREIASRKGFVESSQRAVRDIQDGLSDQKSLAKMETDKRENAARESASSSFSRNSSAKVREDNARFLGSQRQQQTQIISAQDEQLQELSKSTQRLGRTAAVINTELQDQQRMLEELDQDIDRETERLNFVMKRIGRLLKTSDSKQICLIIVLFGLMLLLLFILFN